MDTNANSACSPFPTIQSSIVSVHAVVLLVILSWPSNVLMWVLKKISLLCSINSCFLSVLTYKLKQVKGFFFSALCLEFNFTNLIYKQWAQFFCSPAEMEPNVLHFIAMSRIRWGSFPGKIISSGQLFMLTVPFKAPMWN